MRGALADMLKGGAMRGLWLISDSWEESYSRGGLISRCVYQGENSSP